ncbi:tyrosine decarboxylase, partial [Trichonephila inaurata madagascariensis]
EERGRRRGGRRRGRGKEIKEHVEESVDEVFLLERKRKHSLKYKRSFFVRMVSDPKLYNPKIVSALSSTSSRRHTSDPVDSETGVITPV